MGRALWIFMAFATGGMAASAESPAPMVGADAAAAMREAKKLADEAVRLALDTFRKDARQAKDEAGRADAVRALGSTECKDARILSALAPSLTTDGDLVRVASAEAIGSFRGQRRAAQALVAAIQPNKKSAAVLEAIFRALGAVGDASASQALADFLGDRRGKVAAAAARALGDVGGTAAADALRRALDRIEHAGGIPGANGPGRGGDNAAMEAAKRDAGERSDVVAPALRDALARVGTPAGG